MSKYLIVYGTKEGQTAKIADKIGQTIRDRGFQTDLYDARSVPKSIRVNEYKGALIGSSIHMLRWSKPTIKFVRRHKSDLEKIPSAFFSVSMTTASANAEERAKIHPFVDKFIQKSGWRPKTVVNFAGALSFTKYGWFIKRFMVKIAEIQEGSRPNTSKDIEYTDWEAVTKFANEFIDQVEGNPSAASK